MSIIFILFDPLYIGHKPNNSHTILFLPILKPLFDNPHLKPILTLKIQLINRKYFS